MEQKHRLKTIGKLFAIFFRIGLFTFGGGYAMIPFIQREIVEREKWLTDAEILDMFAISESTPGVIAVNTATFVGYRIGGFWGSLAATLGVVLPAFLIICILSPIIIQFKENPYVDAAFRGIRAGVVVLILGAAKKLFKSSRWDVLSWIVYGVAVVICVFTSLSTIYVLLAALVCGLAITFINARRDRNKGVRP